MSIGSNWKAVWKTVWKTVWTSAPPVPQQPIGANWKAVWKASAWKAVWQGTAAFQGTVAGLTISPTLSAATGTYSTILATVADVEVGDDVFLASVSIGTIQTVAVVVADIEDGDDALLMRITAIPVGVAPTGGYLYKVRPERRILEVS
jgi:hypothetical protein